MTDYRAQLDAAIARLRDKAGPMPPPGQDVGDMAGLLAELEEWAPYRAAANRALLGDD